ncbi:DUF4230 domain-containing protein [Sphingomonas japonica]|uniref:DUF4230 domain-containing protein n=1 Tax=Sphingomonas japonica TaxID=511662 RepID=A0ABX0U2R0_9SPHN|nr:DUF4230 domain-containing protein [Sphingomonas japonica]NIJ23607.1 hypothetical protein [Sphingomonas japonica]
MNRSLIQTLVAVAITIAVCLAAFALYQRYTEEYVVTPEPETGEAVTQVVAARLSGASALKVAELSGTIQSVASDVRGFGMLRSDQVVKAPFSVDYFIDASAIGADDLEWVEASRTLIVNAPDVTVAKPNVDESARTLVRTKGVFVTREAGEQLSQRTSQAAQAKARSEAASPQRLAQARENGRRALASLLGAPLGTLGYGDARVVVTFPAERPSRSRERWDVSRAPADVVGNAR